MAILRPMKGGKYVKFKFLAMPNVDFEKTPKCEMSNDFGEVRNITKTVLISVT